MTIKIVDYIHIILLHRNILLFAGISAKIFVAVINGNLKKQGKFLNGIQLVIPAYFPLISNRTPTGMVTEALFKTLMLLILVLELITGYLGWLAGIITSVY